MLASVHVYLLRGFLPQHTRCSSWRSQHSFYTLMELLSSSRRHESSAAGLNSRLILGGVGKTRAREKSCS